MSMNSSINYEDISDGIRYVKSDDCGDILGSIVANMTSLTKKYDLIGIWNPVKNREGISTIKPKFMDGYIPTLWFMSRGNLSGSCSELTLLVIYVYAEEGYRFNIILRGLIDAPFILFVGKEKPGNEFLFKLARCRRGFRKIDKKDLFGRAIYIISAMSCLPEEKPISLDKFSRSSDQTLPMETLDERKKSEESMEDSKGEKCVSRRETSSMLMAASPPSQTAPSISLTRDTGKADGTNQGDTQKSISEGQTNEVMEEMKREMKKEMKDMKELLENTIKESLERALGILVKREESVSDVIEHKDSRADVSTSTVNTSSQAHSLHISETSSHTTSVASSTVPMFPMFSTSSFSDSTFASTFSSYHITPMTYFPSNPITSLPPLFSSLPHPPRASSPSPKLPDPIFTKSEMILIPRLSLGDADVLAGTKKNKQKALKLMEIAIMLGKALSGKVDYQEQKYVPSVALSRSIFLPWNENGTHGAMTFEQAYAQKDEAIVLLGDAIVQIQMTCDNMEYESARHWSAGNRSKRVTSHRSLQSLLQKYHNICGGGTVHISEDGILKITYPP